MSSYTSVKVAGVVTGTATSLGVAATGVLAKAAIAGLSAVANAAFKAISTSYSQHNSNKVLANSELQLQQSEIASQTQVQISQYDLSSVEAAQVYAIATLANTGYAIANREQVLQSVQQILTASSVQHVNTAKQQCTQVLEANNQQVLCQSLAIACQNASLASGFSQITTQNHQGKIRVIAKNHTGQALVSEIDTSDRVQISTETVGISDGSCREIIAKFEKVLEEEGVIRQGIPDRKFTGGICELASSQDFERNGITPKPTSSAKSSSTKVTDELPRRQQQQSQKTRR